MCTETFQTRLAGILGVDLDRLVIQTLLPVPVSGSARRLLEAAVLVNLNAVLLPAGDIGAGYLHALVQERLDVEGNSSSLGLTVLGLDFALYGICGNSVCELGERCDADVSSCCAEDCPYSLVQCPSAPGALVSCGGHGRCLQGSGACDCFSGYLGDVCDFPFYAQAASKQSIKPDSSSLTGSKDGCQSPSNWQEVIAWKVAGNGVHLGGLGRDMTENYKVWACFDPVLSQCTTVPGSGELACFRYDENQGRFDWWDWSNAIDIP